MNTGKNNVGMLVVDMDNGKRYRFDNYTDYSIEDKYFVIYNGDKWGGAFRLEHLIGYFVDTNL